MGAATRRSWARIIRRSGLSLICGGLLALAQVHADDDLPAVNPARRLGLAQGVQIDLPDRLTKEELADVLEGYLRKLRPAAPIKRAGMEQADERRTPTTAELAAQTPPAVQPAPPAADEAHPAADEGAICPGFPNHRFAYLPATLLWQPALANHYEPRCFAKLLSLSSKDVNPNADEGPTSDFALGATFGLVRMMPAGRPNDGFQIDIFGVAVSRFISFQDATATDFRFGVPLTYASGPWSFKLSYEHTSTHIGDEFLVRNNQPLRDGIREDFCLGAAYRPWEELRLYGVLAYAAHISALEPNADPFRTYFGAEWSRPQATGWHGQPFAALDVDLRGDQDYTPNITIQLGWQWLSDPTRPGMRVALEYFDGRTPFGQFMDRHDNWVALGFYFDY